jgi:hypothetical protein
MSFQDLPSGSNRNRTAESGGVVPFLRMRRNHPPKLPRVQAIPYTPPASTTTTRGNGHLRGRSVERNMNKNRRGNVSERILNDDMIDSYELKLSNSSSESSVLDPCIESRDDYESFGPDRSEPQKRHSAGTTGNSTKSPSSRQNQKTTRVKEKNDNNTSQIYDSTSCTNHNSNKPYTSLSTFAMLSYEMNQYQKLVTDLEYMIRDTVVTPEVAWRTNILVKSVEEADSGIQEQMVQYEQSMAQQERLLLYNKNECTYQNDKKRVAQQMAACTKLRRDFNRCHNSMTSSLQTYKMRQKAEISQLGAVQWNANNRSGSNVVMDTEEDFFERTMRQKELKRMNDSMRKVNDIYHGLAGLVNGQQEHIDHLEDRVHDAKDNVRSGYDEYNCFVTRQNGWNTLCGDMNASEDYSDGATAKEFRDPGYFSTAKLRVQETFYLSMPLETMAEDWRSVQADFIGISNHFFTHCCHRLDCCNDE